MERSACTRRTFLTVSSAALATGVAAPIALPSRGTECAVSPTMSANALQSQAKQSDEGVVYHRDVHTSDLMKGFPPPKDRRVNIENWTDTTESLRWTHLHANVVFKSLPVERGEGPVWILPRRMLDPEKLDRAQVLWGKTRDAARKISVADWLQRSDTDALVVVHDGHIVAEQYYGAMTPHTPHLLWSASKSVLASIMAPLLSVGTVDESAPATSYVPELSKSGLAGATVRQLLDMYTGVRAPCFPTPQEIGSSDEAILRQWSLGTPEFRHAENLFAHMLRAMRILPDLPGKQTPGCYDFLLTLDRDREHGSYFYYTDANPMAVQWIIERSTQTSYVAHLAHLLDTLGAESDGSVGIDTVGGAVSSIGVSLTARDFARWGLMLCNGGAVGGGKVVPGIDKLVADVRRDPGLDRWTDRTNSKAWAPPKTGYKSFMWTSPMVQGHEPIPHAGGAFGQACYVDAARKCVVVKFASCLGSLPGRPDQDEPNAKDPIALQSLVDDVLPELVG